MSILGASLVVLGAVVYLMTGSAHVALTPVAKALDTQITVQASDMFTSVDDTFAKLPGQLLDVEKSASNTVNASGTRNVASKARGTERFSPSRFPGAPSMQGRPFPARRPLK